MHTFIQETTIILNMDDLPPNSTICKILGTVIVGKSSAAITHRLPRLRKCRGSLWVWTFFRFQKMCSPSFKSYSFYWSTCYFQSTLRKIGKWAVTTGTLHGCSWVGYDVCRVKITQGYPRVYKTKVIFVAKIIFTKKSFKSF